MQSNGTTVSGNSRGLFTNLKVQGRVLWALLMREILTRYGRKNIGFLWLFVEPMMFTLVITWVWTSLKPFHNSELPIVAFALTGYSSVLMWRNMPGRCMGAFQSNMSLLHHRQVQIFDVYVARIMLEFMGATSSVVILALAFWAIEWLDLPEDVLQVIGGWMLLAWFGVALAFTLGGLSERFDIIEKLWPPAMFILFPLSGTAFVADAVPEGARNLMLYLPMLNCVEIIREGWFGSKLVAHYDVSYVVIFNTVLMFAGLALARQVGKDVESI